MHILVLTDRFTPEVTAVSFRATEHAKVWLQEGHTVTVVTGAPNSPNGRLFDGYRNRIYQEENIDGVRVIRLWTYMTPNSGTIRRILDYMSFLVSAVVQCGRFPKFDVLIATSPPLFVALAGHLIALIKGRPWIFELRDLWPASIRAVGASQSRLLYLVERVELWLYRKAAKVVAVTYSFKDDLVARGIDPDTIEIVTNGIEVDSFRLPAEMSDVRGEIGVIESDFLLAYIGTTGMAHGLETILEAAALCKDYPAIKFLIMGEGAERRFLERMAADKQLDNVIFKDYVHHDRVPAFLGALDMSIVHLKSDPLFKTVIPSKIFESMAVGTPILHAVEGESADIVSRSGGGVCVPSGDPQAIADVAIKFSKDREALSHMVHAGPSFVRASYDRKKLAADMLSILETVVETGAASGAKVSEY